MKPQPGHFQSFYVVVPKVRKPLVPHSDQVCGVFVTHAQAEGYIKAEILKAAQPNMDVILLHGFVAEGTNKVTLVEWINTFEFDPDYSPEPVLAERQMRKDIWERLTPKQREFLNLSPPSPE
jgi:hypothetical protein